MSKVTRRICDICGKEAVGLNAPINRNIKDGVSISFVPVVELEDQIETGDVCPSCRNKIILDFAETFI